jgi:hypothetical protein
MADPCADGPAARRRSVDPRPARGEVESFWRLSGVGVIGNALPISRDSTWLHRLRIMERAGIEPATSGLQRMPDEVFKPFRCVQ